MPQEKKNLKINMIVLEDVTKGDLIMIVAYQILNTALKLLAQYTLFSYIDTAKKGQSKKHFY